MIDRIKEEVAKIKEEIWAIRTHIHQNPELSFEEFETCKFISDRLTSWGIEHTAGVAGTGVVGVIKGAKEEKVIALRADIDALPILEDNDGAHCSKVDGVMHACGHDFHTASLLGAIRIIHQFKDQLQGSVKFLFQPGEEKLPGGASLMIKEGVLKNPNVDLMFGQHVFPELEAGKVGYRPGMYMASCDEIYVEITGKGGHGAMPHHAVDTVLVACQVVTALQNIVSRKCDPTVPCVLSFGKIVADGATNVIPNKVVLEGTFRTLNEVWRKEAHVLIKDQIEALCEAFGATADVDIAIGYPYLENNEYLTLQAKQTAIEYLGVDNVIDLPIRMTGEDFAFYSHAVPSCFYRVGVRNEAKGIVHGVHHPKFDIEPTAIEIGIGLLAYQTIKQLS